MHITWYWKKFIDKAQLWTCSLIRKKTLNILIPGSCIVCRWRIQMKFQFTKFVFEYFIQQRGSTTQQCCVGCTSPTGAGSQWVGADLSWIRVRGEIHPGLLPSQSQGMFWQTCIYVHIHAQESSNDLKPWFCDIGRKNEENMHTPHRQPRLEPGTSWMWASCRAIPSSMFSLMWF